MWCIQNEPNFSETSIWLLYSCTSRTIIFFSYAFIPLVESISVEVWLYFENRVRIIFQIDRKHAKNILLPMRLLPTSPRFRGRCINYLDHKYVCLSWYYMFQRAPSSQNPEILLDRVFHRVFFFHQPLLW